jgi:hypothetical protein
MEAGKKLADTWVWLELSDEQRALIAARTGRDAGVLYLSLAELLAEPRSAQDGRQVQEVELSVMELEERIAPAITRN